MIVVGNLPIKALLCNVFVRSEYVVEVTFDDSFTLTGAKIEIAYGINVMIPEPEVVPVGQVVTVTYSPELLESLPRNTKHFFVLNEGTFFGWEMITSLSFSDDLDTTSSVLVTRGEDGQAVNVGLNNADVIGPLVADVAELKLAMSTDGPMSLSAFRLVTHTRQVTRVVGGFARFRRYDTTSPDDGISILVDAGGNRYDYMSNDDLLDLLFQAVDGDAITP